MWHVGRRGGPALRIGRRAAAALALLAAVAASGGCGSVVMREPDVARFDFRRARCDRQPPADPAPESAVVLRYLGGGGLWVGWRGEAVLLSPFFSNPSLRRVAFGRNRPNAAAIARGLEGMPLGRVGALLFAHSHYDHLGDAVEVARRAPRARLYVNTAGARALRRELDGRLRLLEQLPPRPLRLTDLAGRPLPFRLLAIPSSHAPHVWRYSFMSGEGRTSSLPFAARRILGIRGGEAFALILELTAGVEADAPVAFRLLYQDSAGNGLLPHLPVLPGGYDLAVTCMASAHLVADYPERLLAQAAPRHVLVTHYESFFARWGPGSRFVPLLTDGRAGDYLAGVAAGLSAAKRRASPPQPAACGPHTADWTMPLVGEWLTFGPSLREEPTRR